MSKVALWAFDEAPGSAVAHDTETGDGLAQNGSFQNGATTTGSGSGVFDGENDYVEIPSDPSFDLDTGSVVITFSQETTSASDVPWHSDAAQTLFSRDSQDYDGGGHLTIYVKSDGSVGVRHQTTDSSYYFSGGSVTLGQPTTIIYSWGPDGSQLIVDGVVVDTGTTPLTLAGNAQPITIGASQAQGSDGVADNLNGFFDGEIKGVAIHDEYVRADTIPCLTQGTLILTPTGAVPIEDLRVGDPVSTMRHGAQPIRWIGSRRVTLAAAAGLDDKLRPVRIMAGALGTGLPTRDLLVSRQHRMLISSKIAARMFDGANVLSAAIKLTALPGIFVDENVSSVTYFHLLFDRHEVIFAENAPTESLFTGAEALKSVAAQARQEILTLFPDLKSAAHVPEPALPIPQGRMQKRLIARHAKNNKPVLDCFPGFDLAAAGI